LLTSSFGSLIVSFAHQLPVIHEVELVSGGELPGADEASKALQVIHVVLGTSDYLGGWDRLVAACTFSTKLSAKIN